MSIGSHSFPPHGTFRELLAAIVDSSDDAIVSKDLNGIIRSWNQGAERIFGYGAEEIVGKHISVLAAPGRLDEFPDVLARISRGERIDHYQTNRRAKDGRILSVSVTVSPIRDASGIIVGASKIARDITEQIRSERALRDVNDTLTRANADLEQFAYSASHDLHEPLRMISAYAQMLRKKFGGELGPAREEYIRYILAGTAQMEHLLRGLRDFVQASTTPNEAEKEVNAGEVLDRTLASMRDTIEGSGASITHGPLPCVRMHAFQLEQLFQNLIGNAIRYRSRHSRPEPAKKIRARRPSMHTNEFRLQTRARGRFNLFRQPQR